MYVCMYLYLYAVVKVTRKQHHLSFFLFNHVNLKDLTSHHCIFCFVTYVSINV